MKRESSPVAATVRVGVGLVRRGRAFLVRERPEGAALAGFWEFPGGKCAPGESAADAARRECLEETGLAVRVDRLRSVVTHEYPHGRVALHFFDCEPLDPAGEPAPGRGFVWAPAAELASRRFPEANAAVLRELASEFGSR